MTTETLSEVGLFAVDHDARVIRGVLVPWGQTSRTNRSRNAPVTFPRGSVRIPRDVSVVTINLDHDRFRPLGRAVEVVDDRAGLVATFALADTEEADAWLADRGEFVKLSAEVRDLRRDADDRGTATLTGAALVTEGAFEGAALFAVDDDDDDEDAQTDDDVEDVDDEPDDESGDEDGDAETVSDAGEGTDMGAATAPETMLAGGASSPVTKTPAGAAAFFAAVREFTSTGSSQMLSAIARSESSDGLFALSDIKISGSGAVGTGVVQPQWLGELWSGRTVARTIIALLASGPLTSLDQKGWRWTTRPEVDVWAGNKTAIPSNTPATEAVSFAIQRFAGGHDLAREFYDFNVTEVIDSYIRAMVDSYARKSDAYVLGQLKAGASAFTPGTAPSGVDAGFAAIIDGALAVIAANASPSYAIVAPDVYRPFLFTPHSDALEYLSMSLGLEEGTAAGFRIVPDARLAAGDVIVGAREAAIVRELPGSPIRTSVVDIVKGGFDEALFGYVGLEVQYPAGVVKANIAPVGP